MRATMTYEILSVIAPAGLAYVAWAMASDGALALYDGVEEARLKLPMVLVLFLTAAFLAARTVVNLGQM